LDALIKNNIPYEIVPGITAALGAAAYAGIPLTARGYATAVRLLTYYKSEIVSSSKWKELATCNETLVFYMSSENLDELVENLINNGIDPALKVAIIEQATTPKQQVYTSTLAGYKNTLKAKQFLSPSLVIIGKVVALHEKYNWLENNNDESQYYFTPIANSK
jgi:siroheme synthase